MKDASERVPAMRLTITDAGRAALLSAKRDGFRETRIVGVGLSMQAFDATPDLKKLPFQSGEMLRSIAGMQVGEHQIHLTVKDEREGAAFPMYGFGLYLSDGVLLGVCSNTQKQGPIMVKTKSSVLMLSIDVFLNANTEGRFVLGDVSFAVPPATTVVQGVLRLATQEAVEMGAEPNTAVTPKTAAKTFAKLTGAVFRGPVTTPEIRADRLASFPAGLEVGPGPALYHLKPTSDLNGNPHLSIHGQSHGLAGALPLPMAINRWGGQLTVGNVPLGGTMQLKVAGTASAAHPPATDSSELLATTQWVRALISDCAVGQIVQEPRSSPRANHIVVNGALLSRERYPQLWRYAQSSGLLVSEEQWLAGRHGCFSTANNSTMFRIPDVRGEFIRCADAGRGLDAGREFGTWQDSQNRKHGHTATSDAAGHHGHDAWTDAQGWHAHDGSTTDAGDHQHISPFGESTGYPWGQYGDRNQHGSNGGKDNDNTWPLTSPAGAHRHSFNTNGAGTHSHAVGISVVGDHLHIIRVAEDGAAESRPRNIAWLTTIRYQ